MMQKYIVRQPILDPNHNVFGYEVLYQEKADDKNKSDSDAANTIESFLSQLNSEKYPDSKITFLYFTPKFLIRNIPRMFTTQKLVIQIDDQVITNPLALQMVNKYNKLGYKIAVIDFQFLPRYFSMLELIEYMKFDFSSQSLSSLEDQIRTCNSFNKTAIAYNVNTKEGYDLAIRLNVKYLQGSYVADRLPSEVYSMDHLQSNFFQLIVAITKDEPNVEEIEEIISRDVSLVYSLLKLVNSTYFALRNRAKSVKQALVILGLGQLKHWIYLMSFKQNEDENPSEFIKNSFLRANFCAELLQYIGVEKITISKSEAYLMGMFSNLGILMGMRLEDVLPELPIDDEIKDALLYHKGTCGLLFDMVISYEKADWNKVTEYAGQLGIPVNEVSQTYFECFESVNATWKNLLEMQ